MHLLTPTLLSLAIIIPTLAAASPQPALISSDYAISLMPRHTLFLRQLSDLQTFDAALGGVRASAITNSGDADRPFKVADSTFSDFATAAQRSCDDQFQGCQKAANSKPAPGPGEPGPGQPGPGQPGPGADQNPNPSGDAAAKGKGKTPPKGKSRRRDDVGALSVGDCEAQKNKCLDAQKQATTQDFKTGVASTNIGPDPLFPDFDLICEG